MIIEKPGTTAGNGTVHAYWLINPRAIDVLSDQHINVVYIIIFRRRAFYPVDIKTYIATLSPILHTFCTMSRMLPRRRYTSKARLRGQIPGREYSSQEYLRRDELM